MSHILKRDQRRGGRGRFHGRQRWRMRPTFLELEGRALLSTIVVNNPTDTPVAGKTDLRQAIALANTNGGAESITFDKTVFNTPQTINLDPALGQLELSDQTGTETITGPRAGVTIKGNYTTAGVANSVFEIEPGATATLSGLTITGGNNPIWGGGVDNYYGTATLIDCTVSGNAGGGFVNNFGTATLTDCTISDNSASYYGFGGGGGVWSYGTTTLTNCTISGNSAAGGGGLVNYGGTLTLTNCNVSGNSAQSGGGVEYGSGGRYGAEYATTTLTNCTISGNSAVWGGGLDNIDGAMTLANCAVDNNQAVATFDFATAEGGGILSNGGSLSISSSTVAGNTATGVVGANYPSGLIAGYGIGGGIALGGNATATVTNTAFLGNLAQGAAGASGLIGGEARGGAIAVGRFNTGDDGVVVNDEWVPADRQRGSRRRRRLGSRRRQRLRRWNLRRRGLLSDPRSNGRQHEPCLGRPRRSRRQRRRRHRRRPLHLDRRRGDPQENDGRAELRLHQQRQYLWDRELMT